MHDIELNSTQRLQVHFAGREFEAVRALANDVDKILEIKEDSPWWLFGRKRLVKTWVASVKVGQLGRQKVRVADDHRIARRLREILPEKYHIVLCGPREQYESLSI